MFIQDILLYRAGRACATILDTDTFKTSDIRRLRKIIIKEYSKTDSLNWDEFLTWTNEIFYNGEQTTTRDVYHYVLSYVTIFREAAENASVEIFKLETLYSRRIEQLKSLGPLDNTIQNSQEIQLRNECSMEVQIAKSRIQQITGSRIESLTRSLRNSARQLALISVQDLASSIAHSVVNITCLTSQLGWVNSGIELGNDYLEKAHCMSDECNKSFEKIQAEIAMIKYSRQILSEHMKLYSTELGAEQEQQYDVTMISRLKIFLERCATESSRLMTSQISAEESLAKASSICFAWKTCMRRINIGIEALQNKKSRIEKSISENREPPQPQDAQLEFLEAIKVLADSYSVYSESACVRVESIAAIKHGLKLFRHNPREESLQNVAFASTSSESGDVNRALLQEDVRRQAAAFVPLCISVASTQVYQHGQ